MTEKDSATAHHDLTPSAWVQRFARRVPKTNAVGVLDVACGNGRHTRLFLDAGYPVVAVDRNVSGVRALSPHLELTVLEADLELATGWPFENQTFAGVVVTNYLFRPILGDIVSAVAPGGVLIYETFAIGNEQYGRPKNPDFLLNDGELMEVVSGKLSIGAYEHGFVEKPKPAVVQRIFATRAN
tara:strand:- start:427 stop:978 length:552 start_codon:yes stop_codon:yes gene_type:complete